jgi:hypothetical protein
MSEPLITLDYLIQQAERHCKDKFGSLELVQELAKEVTKGKPLSDLGYFACLRAIGLSDGTLKDAIRIYRLHRHQAAQARTRRLQRMEKKLNVLVED